jgi:hypothetical protein
MSDQYIWKEISKIVDNYNQMVRTELLNRWKKWQLDLTKPEIYEVVGALVARQVTLATQLANTPSIWNGHIAPLILRTMVDTYITLAWIFEKPIERAREFILYGLGQDKLYFEHIKKDLEKSGKDTDNHPIVKDMEKLINSYRFADLTEINLGSWSGLNTRKMAEEAGCMEIYRYAYAPFSAATHSTWNHVSKYNLEACSNPLHGYHKIPADLTLPVDISYLYRAVEYVEETFELFDTKTNVKGDAPSSIETFYKSIDKLGEEEEEELEDAKKKDKGLR